MPIRNTSRTIAACTRLGTRASCGCSTRRRPRTLAASSCACSACQCAVRYVDQQWRDGYARGRLDHFARRCRERGLAVTPQRLAIFRALMETEAHPRAEEIFAKVRREQPSLSLATVHRTLELLCEAGEAGKVTALHDSARYDGNLDPHHHVVCIRCRRVADVQAPEFERLLDGSSALADFRLLGYTVEIRALCKSCQRSSGRARAKHATRAD
ncbi:MAG: Fur family transcriptional regulator [Candidatus Binataceae bacterium]